MSTTFITKNDSNHSLEQKVEIHTTQLLTTFFSRDYKGDQGDSGSQGDPEPVGPEGGAGDLY